LQTDATSSAPSHETPLSAEPILRPRAPLSPILRWAGSKRALLPELLGAAPRHIGAYFEPFAGSACLFFALRPRRAILGDTNTELVETYRTLRRRPRQVAQAVSNWPNDEVSYYTVRALMPDELSAVGRAARFIYLNRLCFNGVYRTNRQNRFNVPYGRNTGAVPEEAHFVRCATALRVAALEAGDFEQLTTRARRGDFVYLDPPYSRAARDAYGVYGYGSFEGADLGRLIRTLERLDGEGVRFLLSYRMTEDVASATKHWHQRLVAVRAQVGGSLSSRSIRDELLVWNYPSRSAAA
jgi:DNA adenine methylase